MDDNTQSIKKPPLLVNLNTLLIFAVVIILILAITCYSIILYTKHQMNSHYHTTPEKNTSEIQILTNKIDSLKDSLTILTRDLSSQATHIKNLQQNTNYPTTLNIAQIHYLLYLLEQSSFYTIHTNFSLTLLNEIKLLSSATQSTEIISIATSIQEKYDAFEKEQESHYSWLKKLESFRLLPIPYLDFSKEFQDSDSDVAAQQETLPHPQAPAWEEYWGQLKSLVQIKNHSHKKHNRELNSKELYLLHFNLYLQKIQMALLYNDNTQFKTNLAHAVALCQHPEASLGFHTQTLCTLLADLKSQDLTLYRIDYSIELESLEKLLQGIPS